MIPARTSLEGRTSRQAAERFGARSASYKMAHFGVKSLSVFHESLLNTRVDLCSVRGTSGPLIPGLGLRASVQTDQDNSNFELGESRENS